ncbi:palmdelphin isoform X5 [Amphiprion ocellaris]|uniref:palmdelphin isoform X5 n=1 Tax=Amphiprion ocellaris TaxID=80972 RepID=UPI0024117725|nr:palmdelphin isoform X5 [Amphiprion ocellaris]
MEEADLLKERLQAITDKRRIQEDIAKKRRQIEEEKLKLQYIKKKALREQWLMDGLSQQSEEEQEAMRLQAQDEQQQSDQLQSNILRIEKEIEALETQELNISANEEVVLKRLKEVEKTSEDIIKELNAEFRPATFAMEISVEHNKRTGKSQVVSTAAITPETLEERGLKVYDDGRKSVYALHPDGAKIHNGAVGEMTVAEVEELLRQATDEAPTEVQYHQPVYSSPYTGTSRPSTPRTPSKTLGQSPTLRHFQSTTPCRNGAQIPKEENHCSQDRDEQKYPNKTPSPILIHHNSTSRAQTSGEEAKLPCFQIPGHSTSDRHRALRSHFGAETPQRLTNSKTDRSSPNPAAPVAIKVRSEEMPEPVQPVYRAVNSRSPLLTSNKSEAAPGDLTESSCDISRHSPFCAENVASVNLINTLPKELESESITMIFMGYENALDEEEDDIQAELVIIGNNDDDDDDDVENEREEYLSYHPEGYKSKVFQPKVGIAKVAGCRDSTEDSHTNWDDLGLHRPTFIHKPGKHSLYMQGQGVDEPANTNMEKMKICSTGR